MRKGEVCRACIGHCVDDQPKRIQVECPTCSGTAQLDGELCGDCQGRGRFRLTECPRQYVGQEITEAINTASLCENGHLPVSGGLLDQSSLFLSVWQELKNEETRIDNERIERQRRG